MCPVIVLGMYATICALVPSFHLLTDIKSDLQATGYPKTQTTVLTTVAPVVMGHLRTRMMISTTIAPAAGGDLSTQMKTWNSFGPTSRGDLVTRMTSLAIYVPLEMYVLPFACVFLKYESTTDKYILHRIVVKNVLMALLDLDTRQPTARDTETGGMRGIGTTGMEEIETTNMEGIETIGMGGTETVLHSLMMKRNHAIHHRVQAPAALPYCPHI